MENNSYWVSSLGCLIINQFLPGAHYNLANMVLQMHDRYIFIANIPENNLNKYTLQSHLTYQFLLNSEANLIDYTLEFKPKRSKQRPYQEP